MLFDEFADPAAFSPLGHAVNGGHTHWKIRFFQHHKVVTENGIRIPVHSQH